MNGQGSRRRVWATPVLGVIFLALLACGDQPVAPAIAAAARTSTSGGPTVSAVAPDSATRDTTLDLTVTGQNFDNGSRVDLALAGVVSDSVRTNRTTFVNSRKLVANITIAAGADTGKYDVVVTASTGKKGIGTELFAIKLADIPLAVAFADDASLYKITSDGKFGGIYTNGVCGVSATLNLGDVRLSPQQSQIPGKDKGTCGSARFIALNFDDPLTLGASTASGQSNFMSVDKVQRVTADSGTVLHKAQLNGTCSRLVFNPSEFPGTSLVQVTNTGFGTWIVSAPPGSVAYCVGRVAFYHMSFSITVNELPQ